MLKIALAFVLTWMVSTANYIINEITDAPFDAFHPGKKHRPLVANKISVQVLLIGWVLLVAAALGMAWSPFTRPFVLSLGALLLAGILYNVPPLRMKDIPVSRFHSGIGQQSHPFPDRLVRAGDRHFRP